MITAYLQPVLEEVQSKEFTDDLRATVRFIFRFIKLLFLLLTTFLKLSSLLYLKVSRQGEASEVGDGDLLPILGSDRNVNDSTSDSNSEDNLQEQQTEVTLLVTTNNTDNIDNQTKLPLSNYKKELKLMKAAQLRKLCTDYFISYKNKHQAIEAILQFELEQLQVTLG